MGLFYALRSFLVSKMAFTNDTINSGSWCCTSTQAIKCETVSSRLEGKTLDVNTGTLAEQRQDLCCK